MLLQPISDPVVSLTAASRADWHVSTMRAKCRMWLRRALGRTFAVPVYASIAALCGYECYYHHEPDLVMTAMRVLLTLIFAAGGASYAVSAADGWKAFRLTRRELAQAKPVARAVRACEASLAQAIMAWNAEHALLEIDLRGLPEDATEVDKLSLKQRGDRLEASRRLLDQHLARFHTSAPKLIQAATSGQSLA